MKILFATDLHTEKLSEFIKNAPFVYDLAIIGGDIGSYGAQLDLIEMSRQKNNLIIILGNHDVRFGTNIMADPQILHGTRVVREGITIAGVGGGLPAGGWPNEISESEFEILLRGLPKSDIFVSHNPPYNTQLDITIPNGEHVGSEEIRKYILKKKPTLTLHGHIHESFGIDRLGSSIMVNPGPYFEGRYAEIEFRKPEVLSIPMTLWAPPKITLFPR